MHDGRGGELERRISGGGFGLGAHDGLGKGVLGSGEDGLLHRWN